MANKEFGYRRLRAWENADKLAHEVYVITAKFPKEELYGLTSQLRRAALSVPTNIVEGYAKNSKTEFCRYLSISLGSLAEVEYLLSFALDQKYLTENQHRDLMNLRQEAGKYIWNLIKSLR